MLKGILGKLFFTVLLLVSGLFAFIIFKADLALQEVSLQRVKEKTPRLPVYLISYAGGDQIFFKNQHALVYSAQNKGFDFFCNYRPSLLDAEFVEKNKETLSIPKGAGLWVWKPQIILQTMRAAPPNSLIVYTDVGFLYVRDASPFFDMMGDADVLLVGLDTEPDKQKLGEWIPDRILQEWKVNPKAVLRMGGFLMMRNNEKAKVFIQRWLDLCTRKDYVEGELSYKPSSEGKKGSTYDQSLLTVMAEKHPEGIKTVSKEVLKHFTLFHHRHPGDNKPLLWLQILPLKQVREWIGKRWPNFFLKVGF